MTNEQVLLNTLNECTDLEENLMHHLGAFAKRCELPSMDDLIFSCINNGENMDEWIVNHGDVFQFHAAEVLGQCAGDLRRDKRGDDPNMIREIISTSVIAIYILGALQRTRIDGYEIGHAIVSMSEVISMVSNKLGLDGGVWNDLYTLVYDSC